MERFTSPENYHPTMSYNQDQSHNHKITMTLQILDKTTTISEQRFLLPGYYTWKEFEIIETLTADPGRLRITYLDGCIEFMTLGEQHESIKKILAILIEAYLFEKGINFIPVGSATRRAKEKSASFEPDESYYIGEKKANPDLAIEVNITSGSIDKLEKYKRFNITEVWFWENNQLSLYHLKNDNYEQINQSELLPDLDIDLLASCVLMPYIIDARTAFIKGIKK
jgi:Uma2 family endonuclease